jgi:histidinol dehydrogenase
MMQIIKYPARQTWDELVRRPALSTETLAQSVRAILKDVQVNGDKALQNYTRKFDGMELDSFAVSQSEIEQAVAGIGADLKQAIAIAKDNISRFHRTQFEKVKPIETTLGVRCWRKSLPIEKVGLYIPGGTAPLFSTVLMLGVPARLAGCQEIVLCTPPDKFGQINSVILYTANILGIDKIFKVGGAQAIAAMAYGTETIPRVYKIFGPGNQYVTIAKQLVSTEGVAIDLPAGPSEVAVIADGKADPELIASDLLSQAEHGADSQVILITNSEPQIEKVLKAISRQIEDLPRKTITNQALTHSKAILVDSLKTAVQLSNYYAPEHLIIQTKNAAALAEEVTNAGSVFIGSWTPESAGDYASGTNHTLPTNAYARSYSGVSLDSFMKKITFQQISPQGLQKLGPAIKRLAEEEGLRAHRNAVTIRLEKIGRSADND